MKTLLIANRAEIAVRIIRAAREMGIRTVAVFSDADANALHTHLADQAINIGDSEPSASYLNIDAILKAANESGADAIHPGYGFLSERPEFAAACELAGLTFVGPTSAAMRILGDKIAAKQLAESCNVPVTPGYFAPDATSKQLREAAGRLGFPVMLKAAAGGGGRGMRVVLDPERFDDELRIASDEALKAFGDGSMMVEKLMERPRHIEVQILADHHGTVAPLFERECSIQRRHQKLIEEAPSPALTPGLWDAMCLAAVSLCKAAGYRNAGTVEFMVDLAAGTFYFLEVNARLQVEHPVTEAITGLDLVQWQLRVAQGDHLDVKVLPELLAGDRRAVHGHAIEARVIAEAPAKGFLPSSGRLLGWAEPHAPGVRVDSGFGPGGDVSRHYDSLIAKVIAHGLTRDDAIHKLCAALRDFHILGVHTNIAYLLDVLESPGFVSGEFDTGFLGREFEGWTGMVEPPEELSAIYLAASQATTMSSSQRSGSQAWSSSDSFRIWPKA